MRIGVGDIELFFDVEGPKVVGSEEAWIERPTVVLLHAGPGADHSLYKEIVGPRLAADAQVVYLDQRGDGRSSRSDAAHWNLDVGRRTCSASSTRSRSRSGLFGSASGHSSR